METNINPVLIVAAQSNAALIAWAVALVALVVFVAAYRKQVLEVGGKLKLFLDEVVAELRKSTWPTWIELRDSTIVVIIAVAALAVFVGFADWIFVAVITLLTKRG